MNAAEYVQVGLLGGVNEPASGSEKIKLLQT
jgi:hypothetical protein